MLLKNTNPEVVQAAKEQAALEIFELQLSMLRKQIGLSRDDMANRLGVSQPSIANLEKKRSGDLIGMFF